MLDKDELIYTKILNHNASAKEIIDYINGLHKEISKYRNAFMKKRKYAEELEKDLFENCENYVVNKKTIWNKINQLEELMQTADDEMFTYTEYMVCKNQIGVLGAVLRGE